MQHFLARRSGDQAALCLLPPLRWHFWPAPTMGRRLQFTGPFGEHTVVAVVGDHAARLAAAQLAAAQDNHLVAHRRLYNC
jgi:hypothetical protein